MSLGAELPVKPAKFSSGGTRMAEAPVDTWLAVFKAIHFGALVVVVIAALVIAATSFFIIQWQSEIQSRTAADFDHYRDSVTAGLEQARSESAAANERAAAADARAAVLEKAARETQVDLERLRAHVTPRHLRRAQADQIIRILQGYPFSLPVVVLPNDHEAANYAREIVNALSAAGMSIHRAPLYSEARVGLVLAGKRTPEYSLLLTAFELANIPVIQGPLETEFPSEKWDICLTVGSRG
jgi:hypothetical protein